MSMSRPRRRTRADRVGPAALILSLAGLLALTACTTSGSAAVTPSSQSAQATQPSQAKASGSILKGIKK